MTIVDLGQVIERAGLLGEWQRVAAAIVVDGDEAFFDVDIRGAVFAHRAKFYDVTIRSQFADGEEQIQSTDDVIHLREYGVLLSIIE